MTDREIFRKSASGPQIETLLGVYGRDGSLLQKNSLRALGVRVYSEDVPPQVGGQAVLDTGYVSVMEFAGVVADGVSDSSAGFQAAIDATSASKHILFVPPGTYVVKDLRLVTNLQMVLSRGAVMDGGNAATILRAAASVNNVRITGGQWKRADKCLRAEDLTSISRSYFIDMDITDCPIGMDFGSTAGVRIVRCDFHGNVSPPNSNCDTGIRVREEDVNTFFNANSVLSCRFVNLNHDGIRFCDFQSTSTVSQSNWISDCWFELLGHHGVRMGAGARSIKLDSCYCSIAPVADSVDYNITIVRTVADVAGSLNNKYLLFSAETAQGVQSDFYAWFNVSGGGADPGIAGRTAIPVAIATNDSNAAVATALQNAINALGIALRADRDAQHIRIYGRYSDSYVTTAPGGNSGFTVSSLGSGGLLGAYKLGLAGSVKAVRLSNCFWASVVAGATLRGVRTFGDVSFHWTDGAIILENASQKGMSFYGGEQILLEGPYLQGSGVYEDVLYENIHPAAAQDPSVLLLAGEGGASITDAGWLYQRFGITADRPVLPYDGQQFFDSTLGIPVWWSGAAWVNSAGAVV